MRRIFATVLVVVCLLTSCETESGGDIDGYLAALGDFDATAIVTVEFDDRTVSFKLECSVADETCKVRVVEPAEIEGIVVTIAPGGVNAEYDGASFEVGKTDGVLPVTAVAELKRLWSGAQPTERGTDKLGERECSVLVYGSGASETRVWFDRVDCTPTMAEFYEDGSRTMICEFTSFVIGGS